MSKDSDPARILKYFRPPVPIDRRTERIFLLVGAAALFAGYDVNIYGLATSQIQATLHIPENQVGPTAAYFRISAIFAFLLAASADLVGRRRLLLFTIFGQAVFTLLTAFAAHYVEFVGAQFFTRVFGYAEEMLLFVVIAEEIAAKARGWANSTLIAFYFTGAGLAAAVFGAVDILPYGWRALYVIGSVPIFLVAFLRRGLPETRRFETHGKTGFKRGAILGLLKDIARQYPARVATVIIAAAAFGFAISSPTFLAQKYLQDTYHYTPPQVSLVLIPGGLIGLFPVLSETPERLIAGFNDYHLDFRIVVDVAGDAPGREVTLTTLVKTNNLLGRTYLTLITPFHKIVARSMIGGIAEPVR